MSSGVAPHRVAWIEATLHTSVVATRPIGSGASRASWLVELAEGDPVVLREETGRGPMAGTPLDLAREAAVYSVLHDHGLPVPGLLGVEPGGQALLLERADGDASLEGLTTAQLGVLSAGLGESLGRLHSIDARQLARGPLRLPADGPDHARQDVALWAGIQASSVSAPATAIADVALAWLHEQAPLHPVRTSLCHGDAGAGNFLHDGHRLTALLDWEFAHLGDPHDDLAWVAVRNQVLGRPLDVPVVYRSWQAVTGLAVDPSVLEYYRALVLTRMLISCDASLTWAGDGEPPFVQSMLRPYLGLAVVEALRRAGLAPGSLDDLETEARAQWEPAPIAGLLDDPRQLDDLGGPW